MLHHLVYMSSANGRATARELDDILAQSRRRNRADAITGLLLYHEGNFMQVLEGPEDPVQACYDRIAADPRHHDVLLLLSEPVAQRCFAGWDMAYMPFDDLPSAQRHNVIDLQHLHDSDNAPNLTCDCKPAVFVRTFLHSFRDLAATQPAALAQETAATL